MDTDMRTGDAVITVSRLLEKHQADEALAALAAPGICQDDIEVIRLRHEAATQLGTLHRNRGMRALQESKWDRAVYHLARASVLTPPTQPIKQSLMEALDKAQSQLARLGSHLAAKDGPRQRTRIYITGCGRSGTWMLAAMMRCFADTHVQLDTEVDFVEFGNVDAEQSVHVLKRTHDAYKRMDYVPPEISILHIVRFPLDVLVSQHVDKERYITPLRWRQETLAIRRFLNARTSGVITVRYEDLVAQPDAEQERIAAGFGLTPAVAFSEFHHRLSMNSFIEEAMQGIRPPDRSRIGRWQSTTDNVAYCRSIWEQIVDEASWLCDFFNYERPRFD